MRSFNWFFVSLLLIFCAGSAFSIIGSEKSLAEYGYEPFSVKGLNNSDCFTVNFIKHELEEFLPIVSLNAEFFPANEGKAKISLKLNGEEVKELNPMDFQCKEECFELEDGESVCEPECWARVYLDDKKVKEENALNICASTGNKTEEIIISNKSIIGFYRTPRFLKEDFAKQTVKSTYYAGEEIEVKMVVHNSGSAPTVVDLNFVRPIVEEKLKAVEVIGNTYFSKVGLDAGETKEFIHYIKPKKAIKLALLPAIMYYTNIFGETEKITTNTVPLEVKEIEKKLEGKILSEKNTFKVGEKAKISVALINIGEKESLSAGITLNASGLNSNKQGYKDITIKPKEAMFFEFELSSEKEGSFPIGCTIKYFDLESVKSNCEEMTIKFENPKINAWNIETIVLLFFALIIASWILYYVYVKNKNQE